MQTYPGLENKVAFYNSVNAVIFPVANIAVLLLLIPPQALFTFFICAWSLLWIVQKVPTRFERVVRLVAVAALTTVLVVHRAPGFLFGSPLVDWVNSELTGAIGVSYAFLRSVYAVLDRHMKAAAFPAYYFFVPTFFSGPVVSSTAFIGQRPRFTLDNFAQGLGRILYGVVKFGLSSVLQFAAPVTHIAHGSIALQTQSVFAAWVSLFIAGIWLFFNFSAFTDIAIGAGRILGYSIPENFNNPFRASNIADFWRRWHITLGDWLRSVIYNPMTRAGSAWLSPRSLLLAIAAAFATMIVCGLWHQFTRSFLVWGCLHGLALGLHEIWRRYVAARIPSSILIHPLYRGVMWLVTHTFISFTWIFFFPVSGVPFAYHLSWWAHVMPFLPIGRWFF